MTRVALKVSSILLLLLLASSCESGPIPRWEGKLYAGAPEKDGVERAQANEFISARDPEFGKGLWMSYDDFRSFVATYVLGCEKWKPTANPVDSATAMRLYFQTLDMEKEHHASSP